MTLKTRVAGLLICFMTMLSGCVSSKKYNTEVTQRLQLERKTQSLERQLRDIRAARQAYRDSLLATKSQLDTLAYQKDSISQKAGRDLRLLADQLNRLEGELRLKEQELDGKESALQAREKNIRQLRYSLSQQQKSNQQLKQRIKSALTSIDAKDLGVEVRDGRVYVSLSEKLLFQQSSIELDPSGVTALQQLATVVNNNPNFDILIEGHTDSVPFAEGSEYADNWDLSVLRAASIARLLVQNKVDPKRIFATGRSKYHPIADNDTEAGRKKNRRTEIILAPNTESLLNLLD
ncbi:MAG: OmpA family protein [Bacteroidota bacterium]